MALSELDNWALAGQAITDNELEKRISKVTESSLADILFTSGTTGLPKGVMCSHGQNIRVFQTWAKQRKIRVMFIQPGKSTQNADVERFNRTVRHEWLDEHFFESIEHAQLTATQWLWDYNNERPHMAIGGITPIQKLAKAA